MEKPEWKWCQLTNCAAVICPKCGNNCCNGGSGENCPDQCSEAYAYQDKAVEEGSEPSREECNGEIPIPPIFQEDE